VSDSEKSDPGQKPPPVSRRDAIKKIAIAAATPVAIGASGALLPGCSPHKYSDYADSYYSNVYTNYYVGYHNTYTNYYVAYSNSYTNYYVTYTNYYVTYSNTYSNYSNYHNSYTNYYVVYTNYYVYYT
jgi:hypothetical protein